MRSCKIVEASPCLRQENTVVSDKRLNKKRDVLVKRPGGYHVDPPKIETRRSHRRLHQPTARIPWNRIDSSAIVALPVPLRRHAKHDGPVSRLLIDGGVPVIA